jgi:hypothetical protein
MNLKEHHPTPDQSKSEEIVGGTSGSHGAQRLYERLCALKSDMSEVEFKGKIERAFELFDEVRPAVEEQLLVEATNCEQLPSPQANTESPCPIVMPMICGHINAGKTTLTSQLAIVGKSIRSFSPGVDIKIKASEAEFCRGSRSELLPAKAENVVIVSTGVIGLSASTSTGDVMAWLASQGAHQGFVRGRFYGLVKADCLESIDCWGHDLDTADLLQRGEIFSKRPFAKENDFHCFEAKRPTLFRVGDWLTEAMDGVSGSVSVKFLDSDPCGQVLNRLPGSIWCDFPLQFAGQLIGKLSCDLAVSSVEEIDPEAVDAFWQVVQLAAPYLDAFVRCGRFTSLKERLVGLTRGTDLCRYVETELPRELRLTDTHMKLHAIAVGSNWAEPIGDGDVFKRPIGRNRAFCPALIWHVMQTGQSIKFSDLGSEKSVAAECKGQGVDIRKLSSLNDCGATRGAMWVPIRTPIGNGPTLGVLEVVSSRGISKVAARTIETVAEEFLGPTVWHLHLTERCQQEAVEHFNHWCLRVDAKFRELQRQVQSGSTAAKLELVGKTAVGLLRESNGPAVMQSGLVWMITRAEEEKNKVYVICKDGRWGSKLQERTYEGSVTQRALEMGRIGRSWTNCEVIPEDDKVRSCESVAYPFSAFGVEGAIVGKFPIVGDCPKLERRLDRYAPYVEFLAEQMTRLDAQPIQGI